MGDPGGGGFVPTSDEELPCALPPVAGCGGEGVAGGDAACGIGGGGAVAGAGAACGYTQSDVFPSHPTSEMAVSLPSQPLMVIGCPMSGELMPQLALHSPGHPVHTY